MIETITDFYDDGLFPVLLCPPGLYREMLNINILRARAVSVDDAKTAWSTLNKTADEILEHILDFSPDDWAELSDNDQVQMVHNSNTSTAWLLLGRINQSAVALYCISSLQSLGVLPQATTELDKLRSVHEERLVSCLEQALVMPEIKMFLMWPLVIAGMEAVHTHARNFVRRELEKMATSLGTRLPLMAMTALNRFWSSAGRTWDECFDRPYAFVT